MYLITIRVRNRSTTAITASDESMRLPWPDVKSFSFAEEYGRVDVVAPGT
jgi:hypothetical protein